MVSRSLPNGDRQPSKNEKDARPKSPKDEKVWHPVTPVSRVSILRACVCDWLAPCALWILITFDNHGNPTVQTPCLGSASAVQCSGTGPGSFVSHRSVVRTNMFQTFSDQHRNHRSRQVNRLTTAVVCFAWNVCSRVYSFVQLFVVSCPTILLLSTGQQTRQASTEGGET